MTETNPDTREIAIWIASDPEYRHDEDAEVTVVAVDYGDGDWSTECEARMDPDGTITILDMRRWRHTIDHEQTVLIEGGAHQAKEKNDG